MDPLIYVGGASVRLEDESVLSGDMESLMTEISSHLLSRSSKPVAVNWFSLRAGVKGTESMAAMSQWKHFSGHGRSIMLGSMHIQLWEGQPMPNFSR